MKTENGHSASETTPFRKSTLGKLNTGASQLDDDEVQAVLAVIRSGSLSRDYGPERQDTVLQFEQAFASQVGARYAVAVTSGTAALKVALVAAGVGPGHEVILPSCTFPASANVVITTGAVPVFAEIDESLTLDPDDIKMKLSDRTRAIMPVHLSGVPCQMDRICEIARENGLKIIEDCAQSAGLTYQGRHIGTWGDLGAFSLQFSKVITSGEGGIVTSDDPDLYERAVRFHDQGSFREKTRWPGFEPKLDKFAGENYRMSELTGAVALTQLSKLEKITAILRSRFRRFKEGISDIPSLQLRPTNDDVGHLGMRWAILFDDSDSCQRFSRALKKQGLSSSLIYKGIPVYLQPHILNQSTANPGANPWKSPAYDGNITYYKGLCPKSEDLMQRVLTVATINPHYSDQDVDEIISAVRKAATEVM